MTLQPIYKKVERKMQEEGRVSTVNGYSLFGSDYMEQIKKVKDNFVQELREKGIIFQMTRGDDHPSYI
jgi:hypothetical protein